MNILLVTQYFWPENFRVNDLAAALNARGHEVTVLTGKPNYPGGDFFPGYGFFGCGTEDHEGVRVTRVPLVPRGHGGGLRLAINYLSFALFASLAAFFKCRGSYDVIFVYEVSPITVGLPALAAKLRRRTPVLLWVLDLWPESLSATGAVRNRLVLRAVAWLVRLIYRGSDRVLVQSRAFEQSVKRMGVPAARIVFFPNWAEALFDATADSEAPPPVPLPRGFRVMYAGNVGAAQDFPGILAAAELLRTRADVQWIIVGEGRLHAWVAAEIEKRGLAGTVHLVGNHPLATMPAFFREADAMLVSLRRDPIFALTVPGKLQSYLACGRPVLAMLDGEGARIVRESGAGLACDAERPDELARCVIESSAMTKESREEMGRRGRAYYAEHFSREHLLARLEELMAEVAAGSDRMRRPSRYNASPSESSRPVPDPFRNKTILITGGTGSFGRALLNTLLKGAFKEVRIFSRDELKQDLMRAEITDARVKFHIGDVRSRDSVDDAMDGVDHVFHAAALKQVPSCDFFPMEAVQTNVIGSHNVIESAIAHEVKRVICLSTDKAVHPINAMGMTKALMEKIAQATTRRRARSGTVVAAVRYGNVMYSGGVIPLFVGQILGGKPLTITEPGMTRFMLPLADAIDLVLVAFPRARPGDIFVRKAPACTIRDLASALKQLFRSSAGIRLIGMRHGEKLYETLVAREELRRSEDLGDYFRVRMDDRGLDYSKYFTEGDREEIAGEDYTSHNTVRLDVRQTEQMLMKLPEIRAALGGSESQHVGNRRHRK